MGRLGLFLPRQTGVTLGRWRKGPERLSAKEGSRKGTRWRTEEEKSHGKRVKGRKIALNGPTEVLWVNKCKACIPVTSIEQGLFIYPVLWLKFKTLSNPGELATLLYRCYRDTRPSVLTPVATWREAGRRSQNPQTRLCSGLGLLRALCFNIFSKNLILRTPLNKRLGSHRHTWPVRVLFMN